MTSVRHDANELKWPPAGSCTSDILVRWLAYADHICILVESKTELSAILNVFIDVLTDYGMTLSAEKSFWVTLGCSLDTPDREVIQLPCGPVGYIQVPGSRANLLPDRYDRLTHSLTAALDQLRVVASSTSSDLCLQSGQHQQTGQCLLPLVATKFFVDDPADASSQRQEECHCGLLLTVAVSAKQVCSPVGDRCDRIMNDVCQQ